MTAKLIEARVKGRFQSLDMPLPEKTWLAVYFKFLQDGRCKYVKFRVYLAEPPTPNTLRKLGESEQVRQILETMDG